MALRISLASKGRSQGQVRQSNGVAPFQPEGQQGMAKRAVFGSVCVDSNSVEASTEAIEMPAAERFDYTQPTTDKCQGDPSISSPDRIDMAS